MNGAAWAPGSVSPWSPPAVKLEGKAYVSLGTQLSLVQNVPACTMAAWVCVDKLAETPDVIVAISKHHTAPTIDSRVTLQISNAGYFVAAGRSVDSAPQSQSMKTVEKVFKPGTWVHVAGVLDYAADSITLYVNGVAQPATGTVKFGGKATPNTTSTCGAIGADDDGSRNYLHGRLADVRIYNRALTKEEVAELAVPTVTPR